MTSRRDVHQLVDEIPASTLAAAEAFLAFLRDRLQPDDESESRLPGQTAGQAWAANERRGLRERRDDRDAAPHEPDPDDMA